VAFGYNFSPSVPQGSYGVLRPNGWQSGSAKLATASRVSVDALESPMIIPSGPRLVDLLGLSMTDERVGQALRSLVVAVPEVTPYEELDVTVESLGVDIRSEPPVQRQRVGVRPARGQGRLHRSREYLRMPKRAATARFFGDIHWLGELPDSCLIGYWNAGNDTFAGAPLLPAR
jgi:hypothetical protein